MLNFKIKYTAIGAIEAFQVTLSRTNGKIFLGDTAKIDLILHLQKGKYSHPYAMR